MQLEWDRFIQGITEFKTGQGLFGVFCAAVFLYCFFREKTRGNRFFATSFFLGLIIVCPLTAVMLLKVYTPYYDWKDLQQLFPMIILLAYGSVELFSFLRKQSIPGLRVNQKIRSLLGIACIMSLLVVATNFYGLDKYETVDDKGIPVATSEVFDSLKQVTGDQTFILAAPPEMLQYARMYEANWQPIYGRDLWSGKAASYINSNYQWEYEYYTLLEDAGLMEEERVRLVEVINEGRADCIIVPDFWLEFMSGMPKYDSVRLTASYIAIMKKDLVTR